MKRILMVQNVLSFFQRIENNIWGNQLISNKYYASFSIILVAFIGAMVTGGKILNSTFDLDIEVSFYSAITIIFFITALNIYESIIATDNVKIAMLRALLVFGFIIASFFFGILTSVIIAIIIAIVVAAIVKSNPDKEKIQSLNEEKLLKVSLNNLSAFESIVSPLYSIQIYFIKCD
jgi:hypothetical protein